MAASTTAAAFISGALILLITAFVLREAWPAMGHGGGLRFFTDPSWYPREGTFGLTPMVIGSLMVMIGSVALAGSAGVAIAIVLNYYLPASWGAPIRGFMGLLGGIPSVVYGFWGLVVLVPLIGAWQPPGPSLLAAILILALMILPAVVLTSDATLARIPQAQLDAAAALSLSRFTTISRIVLPSVRRSLLAGLLLQLGRAAGETMAVLMVAGNIVQVPRSFFDPLRTLTANIALEMAYATGTHRAGLFVSGLVLIVVATLAVMAAARLLGNRA